jgi:uncharacterized protein
VARDIKTALQKDGTVTTTATLQSSVVTRIKEQYQIGDTTINDIIEELKKPNRDPREGYPKPIMQKGVLSFEDLKEGMKVTGKIKNVVDFGAFVDLGIKETALVHISELSDTFVKDPMSIIKVGDVFEFTIIGLDLDRRRISLTRKSGQAGMKSGGQKAQAAAVSSAMAGSAPAGSATASKTDRAASSGKPSFGSGGKPPFAKPHGEFNQKRESDGTMYNPFADAFKKMQEKKKNK